MSDAANPVGMMMLVPPADSLGDVLKEEGGKGWKCSRLLLDRDNDM